MKKQIVSENASPVKVHPKPSLALNRSNSSGTGWEGAYRNTIDVADGVQALLNQEANGSRGNEAKAAIWVAANKAALAEASRQGVNLVEVDRTVSHFRAS